MRSMLSATAMIARRLRPSADARPEPPVKPKPVATVPVRPALQTPADTAKGMAAGGTAVDPVRPRLGRALQRRHQRRSLRAHGQQHQGVPEDQAARRPAY